MDSVTHDLAAGPLPAYRAMVAAGALAPDSAQALAAQRLQALWTTLRGYDPTPRRPGNGLFALLRRRGPAEAPPRGLYLVGAVGRGKSMLMDLFFDAADVRRKRRIHFHRFMQDAHAAMFAIKREDPGVDDPIPPLADQLAARAALLCFDEFQVHDIADAMILGRLFEALFDRGVVVVATSNTAPDDLFKGQPGRDAFLPFIALIKRHVDVLELDAARDFRRARMRALRTWHVPADAMARRALDAAFGELTGGVMPAPVDLVVTGRRLVVPIAAEGVARFDFAALCGVALGPGDYLAIANRFHTLILDDIPRLSPDNYDEARRFITLIDTLYDQRVKLLASAAAAPDKLYQRGENAAMFERTASRLDEMQSEAWLAQPHPG
ncbi:MAG: cell division protein ZapE [Proteobacteria bacterium]|nr:cell division protein ZapE [Pseudomonadota bacterium]